MVLRQGEEWPFEKESEWDTGSVESFVAVKVFLWFIVDHTAKCDNINMVNFVQWSLLVSPDVDL